MKKLIVLFFLAIVWPPPPPQPNTAKEPRFSVLNRHCPQFENRATRPDIIARTANFSGIWEGTWINGRGVIIAIERINPQEVVAIYSWGTLYNEKNGWPELKGSVAGYIV